ncbi:MAG: hypothetical protein D4R44_08100 [Actinobacteria bacterium]|nr:MAG: hypothetical protein D4R44_08100 [Actinomycetota bacterium]
MSFFDSGAADLGNSLAGAGAGGLAGFIQGLQLKQQMERQHLENRKLAFPGVTALGHGAYLEHDPETGQLTMKQAPGTLAGGHQNYAINQFLANPTDPKNMALMDYIFKTNPGLIEAKKENQDQQAGQHKARANLSDVQAKEFPTTASERRDLLRARAEAAREGGNLSREKQATEVEKQGLYGTQADRVAAITEPDVSVREGAAKANQARAERLRQQIENDRQLTPARKQLLEARAKQAEAAAEKHLSGGEGKAGAKGSENTVTVGVDSLGRKYVKPTFKKPEDTKAFMNTYQQWTAPLKNIEIGMLEFGTSKVKKLAEIRKLWIEKNHPNEAEIAGFDQAMQEAQ